MYYLKIRTKYNEIKLIIEEEDFYDERLQDLLHQPYISQVYLRWIGEKDYQENKEYQKIKKLERLKK